MTYIIHLNLYKSGSLPEYELHFVYCISFSFLCQVEFIKILKSRFVNNIFSISLDKTAKIIYTEFGFSDNIFSKEVQYVYRP